MEINSKLAVRRNSSKSFIFSVFISGESEEDETEVGESDGYEDEVDFEERRRRGGFSEDQVTVSFVSNSLRYDAQVHFCW